MAARATTTDLQPRGDEARAMNTALLALCALAAPPKQKEKKERPPALSAPPSAPLARRAGY